MKRTKKNGSNLFPKTCCVINISAEHGSCFINELILLSLTLTSVLKADCDSHNKSHGHSVYVNVKGSCSVFGSHEIIFQQRHDGLAKLQ